MLRDTSKVLDMSIASQEFPSLWCHPSQQVKNIVVEKLQQLLLKVLDVRWLFLEHNVHHAILSPESILAPTSSTALDVQICEFILYIHKIVKPCWFFEERSKINILTHQIQYLPMLWDKTPDSFCLVLVHPHTNQMSSISASRNPSCILEVVLSHSPRTCILQSIDNILLAKVCFMRSLESNFKIFVNGDIYSKMVIFFSSRKLLFFYQQ